MILTRGEYLRIVMKSLYFVVLGFEHFGQLPDHHRVARHHAVDLHQPDEKDATNLSTFHVRRPFTVRQNVPLFGLILIAH